MSDHRFNIDASKAQEHFWLVHFLQVKYSILYKLGFLKKINNLKFKYKILAKEWDWSSANPLYDKIPLGNRWQPFPIETFMPLYQDKLLFAYVDGRKVVEQFVEIFYSEKWLNFWKNKNNFWQKFQKQLTETKLLSWKLMNYIKL